MFAEIAKTFLEFLKLAPRYLIALGVMAAILLFASEEFLRLIGVFELAQDNRSVLGLTLLVSVSLFTISIGADGVSIVKSWWRTRSFYQRVTDRLNCLTEDEKQILRFYIAKQTRANVLRYDDGVVQSLVSDGSRPSGASINTSMPPCFWPRRPFVCGNGSLKTVP
ncbi:super-infection exclusion protein B [Limnohabitans sp.]|uniref:super-infection exclusion protein B n=1 Tax=Limnohabitans sp. TaxID=1907725 RepID=UPI00286F1EC7|nr:super-infection exclusion protein B [Limnohabitans sp.]